MTLSGGLTLLFSIAERAGVVPHGPFAGCTVPEGENPEAVCPTLRLVYLFSEAETRRFDFWPFRGVAWTCDTKYLRTAHFVARRDRSAREEFLYGNGAMTEMYSYTAAALLLNLQQPTTLSGSLSIHPPPVPRHATWSRDIKLKGPSQYW